MYEGKVIDFHIHVGRREDWHPWVNEYLADVNPVLYADFDTMMQPASLAEYMRGQGAHRTVVLAELSPKTTGVVTNKYVHEFCHGQEQFIPFASIDPVTDPDPQGALEECVKDMGFRGLKLYPTYQHFFPNDPSVYPLYEKAREFGIPVMFHTGTSIFKNAKVKFGDPLHLDEVAADFPDLTLVMAHSGRGLWHDRAFTLSKIHENLYMEISGLPPQKLMEHFPRLGENADRVIFGSDWPGLPGIANNIAAIRALPLEDAAVEKILYGNAARVLGLPGEEG